MERALSSRRFGPYTLQAAIAAVHAEAPTAAATDWAQIVGLYDVLVRAEPSPVVELNRAVAVAMRDGPAAGLALIDAILARGDLADYHLAHSARADLCRRLGRTAEARAAYERALAPRAAGAGAALPRAAARRAAGLRRPRAALRRVGGGSAGTAHSMTLSARASTEGGTLRPKAFAVFRLTTSSNLVGCSIGISAGFAPLRMRST